MVASDKPEKEAQEVVHEPEDVNYDAIRTSSKVSGNQ